MLNLDLVKYMGQSLLGIKNVTPVGLQFCNGYRLYYLVLPTFFFVQMVCVGIIPRNHYFNN